MKKFLTIYLLGMITCYIVVKDIRTTKLGNTWTNEARLVTCGLSAAWPIVLPCAIYSKYDKPIQNWFKQEASW